VDTLTNEPVSMPVGTSGPHGRDIKRSKVSVTWGQR